MSRDSAEAKGELLKCIMCDGDVACFCAKCAGEMAEGNGPPDPPSDDGWNDATRQNYARVVDRKRCAAEATFRDDEHRTYRCLLPAGHLDAHESGATVEWTDETTRPPWEPKTDDEKFMAMIASYVDEWRKGDATWHAAGHIRIEQRRERATGETCEHGYYTLDALLQASKIAREQERDRCVAVCREVARVAAKSKARMSAASHCAREILRTAKEGT